MEIKSAQVVEQSVAASVSLPALSQPYIVTDSAASALPLRIVTFHDSPTGAKHVSNRTEKQVYKFQVAWDPVNKKKCLGYDIRSHILIAPYRGKSRTGLYIEKGELPASSPLRTAVDACREKGIPVVTGYWNYWNNPIAILFYLDHMPQQLIDRYILELKRDHNIDIPINDDKARQSVVLSYCAVELIIQFELAIPLEKLSEKSWIRFHNWTGAAGAIFLPQWFKPHITVALQLSKTQLTDMAPRNAEEAKLMAREAKVSHRYALEVGGANSALQLILPKGVSSDLIERELFRKPTHRLKDPRPQWLAKLLGLFVCTRPEPGKRLLEPMHSDEGRAFDDLKDINIPMIRTWR